MHKDYMADSISVNSKQIKSQSYLPTHSTHNIYVS